MLPAPRKFRTPRAQRRERWRRVLLVCGAVATGSLLTSLVVYAARSPHVRIQYVTVEGVGGEYTARVETALRDALQGSTLFVPRDNTLMVRTVGIAAAIMGAVPELSTVEVSRQGLQTLHVRTGLREPVALWCGDVVPEIEGGAMRYATCYLVDNTGYIFSRISSDEVERFDEAAPRIFGALTEGGPIGRYALDGSEYERMQALWSALFELNLSPLALLLVDEQDAELYLATGHVRFLRSEAESIIQTIRALVRHGTLTPDTPFTYLDLRFGGKVYLNRTGADSSEETPLAESLESVSIESTEATGESGTRDAN